MRLRLTFASLVRRFCNCPVLPLRSECPQGVHCRFSHVTEEVIYHASKFKTQQCSHPIDKEGRCAGYGAHCAKAHGPQGQDEEGHAGHAGGSWTMRASEGH